MKKPNYPEWGEQIYIQMLSQQVPGPTQYITILSCNGKEGFFLRNVKAMPRMGINKHGKYQVDFDDCRVPHETNVKSVTMIRHLSSKACSSHFSTSAPDAYYVTRSPLMNIRSCQVT